LVLEQTPEAVARRRIFELVPTFSKVLSPAEQSELDRLKALYPDRPLDPNDPSFRAIQAFDAYLERRSERQVVNGFATFPSSQDDIETQWSFFSSLLFFLIWPPSTGCARKPPESRRDKAQASCASMQ